MKIEEIYKEWEKDGKINIINIGEGVSEIPTLHNKYFKIYITENVNLKKQKALYKKLEKLKTEYYLGNLSHEELKEHEWEPFQLKIPRTMVSTYLESDEELINFNLKIEVLQTKIEYLESIIKMINNRGYQYKTILDFKKFENGI